jgi:hypothetical protein
MKNPSLISCVSSKISRVKFPLHLMQNMNWEFFLFNNRKQRLMNIYFGLKRNRIEILR